DRFGNLVQYHYDEVGASVLESAMGAQHNRAVFPDHILYSRHKSSDFGRKVEFHYVEKTDPLGRIGGYEHHTEKVDNRLLESITVTTFDGYSTHQSVRSYHLEYGITPGH